MLMSRSSQSIEFFRAKRVLNTKKNEHSVFFFYTVFTALLPTLLLVCGMACRKTHCAFSRRFPAHNIPSKHLKSSGKKKKRSTSDVACDVRAAFLRFSVGTWFSLPHFSCPFEIQSRRREGGEVQTVHGSRDFRSLAEARCRRLQRSHTEHAHAGPTCSVAGNVQVDAIAVCAFLVRFRFIGFCFLRSESASYANRCLWWVNWLSRACVGSPLLLRQSFSPVTNFDHRDASLSRPLRRHGRRRCGASHCHTRLCTHAHASM